MQFNFLKLTALVSLLIFCTMIQAKSNDELEQQNSLDVFAYQLNQYQGKVIFVDFWASWCIPCRQSFPWMNKIQQQYASQGFQVISINLDNDKAFALTFLKEIPANFSVIYDPQGKIARQYKLKGMPSSFIINRAGKIVSMHTGFSQEKSVLWQDEIKLLLRQ